MNLLKSLILEEKSKGKCVVCYRVLENEDVFYIDNEKKAYFCCNNCKIEWMMKNNIK
ncbi:MAG: hypothetical protein WC393_05370 [Candidatus Nanoarchaeia archaeon]